MTDDAPRTAPDNQPDRRRAARPRRPATAACCSSHSSLRSLGPVPGGAETVVRGLVEALGPDGTLLMPALSYARVTPEQPLFDVRLTPSNVGALPETFRTRPGTLRSIHPTHSVCGVGRLAAELLGRHIEDRTPCGPRSPFHLLPEYGGQILMLGCGLRPNTSMHAVGGIGRAAILVRRHAHLSADRLGLGRHRGSLPRPRFPRLAAAL